MPHCTYPYVLWETKSSPEDKGKYEHLRIVRADPKNMVFEQCLQDAMGQESWVPVSDGNLILACSLAALNSVADKAYLQGWFKDGMVK